MNERHRAAVAAYLILRRGDKVLLGRRQNTGWYDGWYNLPAGKIEPGEFALDGMLREVQEEVGITLDPADVSFAHAMYRREIDETWVDYFFFVSDDSGKYEPINSEPDKCDELDWFPVTDLPANMIPNNRQALEGFLAGETFTDMVGITPEEAAVKLSL